MFSKNVKNLLAIGMLNPIDFDESKFQSATCKKSLAAFHANVVRTIRVCTIPGTAFGYGFGWAFSVGKSQEGTLGRKRSVKGSYENRDIINERTVNNLLKFLPKPDGKPEEWQRFLGEWTYIWEKIIAMTAGGPLEVLENLFRSVLVDAWTTMEALTESLYYGIKDERPLARFGAFPKKVPGKLPGFRSRKKIRDSFKYPFLDSAIDAALADTSLDGLALIRNVIVHKGGIADQDFKDGIALSVPYLDSFQNLVVDQDPIATDGTLVKTILDGAFASAYRLIQAVDQWIILH